MALGQFVAPQGNFPKSTPFNAKQAEDGRPLVVIVREFRADFATKEYPDPRPAIFCQIADLSNVVTGGQAELFPNALLATEVVAERLADYAPGGSKNPDGEVIKLPVRLGTRTAKQGGRKYRIIEPLDGDLLALAEAWDKKNPTVLQDAYQVLVDEANANAADEAPARSSNAAAKGKYDDNALQAAIKAMS